MRRLSLFMFCVLAVSWTGVSAATGEKRIALVIGNSAYEHVARLENPENDALAIAQSLRDVGFTDVALVENADFRALRLALQEFSRKVAGSDIAVVYFAGHGIEVGGTNYLIPTDAKLAEAGDVEFETINFGTVMNAMADARKLKLFILDACRDNPFVAAMARTKGTRSIGRGLARVEPEANTLVAYAAKSGTQALDGDGANSPFAAALVAEMARPGVEIGYLFRRVRDRVMEETGGRQEPFTYGSLGGEEIYLKTASAGAPDKPGAADKPPASTGASAADRLLAEAAAAWPAVQDTTSVAVLRAYIARYEGSIFADLAAARLSEIEVGGHSGQVDPPGADPGIGDQALLQGPPAIPEPARLTRSVSAVPVGKWAEGIAFDGQHIWVAESGQRTIAAVDPASGGIVRRVKVGRLPVGMSSISDGRVFSLVHTDQLVWQQSPGNGNGKRLTKLNECPEDITATDAAVWVITLPECSSASSRAIKIDPNSGRQWQTGVLGEWGQAIAVGFGRAWVAHARYGAISMIDTGSLAVETTFVDHGSLWAITTNSSGVHTGGRIDDNNDQGLIVTIDPATGQELYRRTVSSRVGAMASDDRNVVAVGDNGVLWVLSADGRVLRSIISLGTGDFRASDVIIIGDVLVISRQQDQGENGSLLALGDWRPQ